MKAKDLIKSLEQLDPEMEVCIFDHKTNMDEDSGDGTSAGIYPQFEVSKVPIEDIKEGTPEWIALSFTNDNG
jgi:hypothetical protein